MYKIYAYIKFQLMSPLAIGGTTSSVTDKDVLKNAIGEPYIPASALAGVYRSLFSKEDVRKYFGDVEIVSNNEKAADDKDPAEAIESSVIIYDGRLCSDQSNLSIGIRNGVGLDQFRTVNTGAKYDYEVVEPGSVFWTAIEYSTDDKEEYDIVDRLLMAWKNEQVMVGGKTTRGLGRLKALELKKCRFELPKDIENWLQFDLYSHHWEACDEWNGEGFHISDREGFGQIKLTLTLKQESPLTVRVYTTEVSKDTAAPDYKQLTYKQEDREIAVIPGTSWAGTFRHSMIQHIGGSYAEAGKELEELFGRVGVHSSDSQSARSKILFSESYFDDTKDGECYPVVSRNAINRFSGGAVDTALFTEKIYYGQAKSTLTILIPEDINSKYLKALAASIADLHEGFLTVGGESSIGHGLFSVTQLTMNGVSLTDSLPEDKDNSKKITGISIYSWILERKQAIDNNREQHKEGV